MHSRILYLRLLIVPLLILALEPAVISAVYPLHSGATFDADPAYVYLFNGLVLLNGSPPFHIDHPGTPLQMLIALVLFVKWALMRVMGISSEDLFTSVVSHPESYLQSVSFVLLALNVIAVTYIGARVQKVTSNYWLAVIAQLSPIFFSLTVGYLILPAAESLLIFSSVLLIGQLAPRIFKSKSIITNDASPSAAWTGIICGLGIATKVTFLPLLGLIALYDTRRERLRALAFAALAFLVLTLPVLPQARKIFIWMRSLATHSGRYGTGGEVGVLQIDAFVQNFWQLFHGFEPLYLPGVMLLLYLAITQTTAAIGHACNNKTNRQDKASRVWKGQLPGGLSQYKVGIIFIIVICAQTVLVLKHFGFHYMIPVLPLALIFWALILWRLEDIPKSRGLVRAAQVIVAIWVLWSTFHDAHNQYKLMESRRKEADADMTIIESALGKFQNPVILGTFRCKIQVCATFFGAGYAPGLAKRVPGVFANYFDFNIWNSLLNSPENGWVSVDTINKYLADGRDVLLLAPLTYPELKTFTLEPIVTTPIQVLFRVTGLSAKP